MAEAQKGFELNIQTFGTFLKTKIFVIEIDIDTKYKYEGLPTMIF